MQQLVWGSFLYLHALGPGVFWRLQAHFFGIWARFPLNCEGSSVRSRLGGRRDRRLRWRELRVRTWE
jgi:hypothetical protein